MRLSFYLFITTYIGDEMVDRRKVVTTNPPSTVYDSRNCDFSFTQYLLVYKEGYSLSHTHRIYDYRRYSMESKEISIYISLLH